MNLLVTGEVLASFSKNLSYNYLGTLSISLLGFFITPFLIRFLGIDTFGAWALLGAFMAYTSLFDFGVGLAGMKLVAEHSIETERKRINELFSNVVLTYVALSLLLFAVGLSLIPFLHDIFKVPTYLQHDFTTAYIIFVVSAGISFSGASFSGMLQGLHDFKSYNKAIILQAVGTTLSALIVGSLTHSLVYMALSNAAITIGIWLFKASMLYAKGLRLSRAHISKATIKHIFNFSSAVFVVNVAARIIFDTDTVIIGIFSGTAAVASYQVAQNPNTALRKIGDQLNSVTLTAASKLYTSGKIRELQDLYLNATKYSLIIMLPFLVCVSFLAKDFLRTWVGPHFESAYLVLIFLSYGIAIVNIQATATQVILSIGKHRRLAYILSAEAIANLVLSIILLKHIGIAGVALGTTIPTFFTAVFYSLPQAAMHLELSYSRLIGIFTGPIYAALIGVPLLILAKLFINFNHLGEVLLAGILYSLIYIAGLILVDKKIRVGAVRVFAGLKK
jgi:O-antigen/teichoic acid export membrane protein